MSSMTFQEKSQWVQLVGLLVAFGGYFQSAYLTLSHIPAAQDILPVHAGLFIGATAVLVIIQIVGHLAVVIFNRDTETDERDRLIELTGERYGSFVLATGVFFSLCAALVTEGNAIMAHVLLGFWVLAQMVENLSQIIMYRRSS
ncbi:MAG: hypothetical protein SH820_16425 [Xanthomonadales bacterium]|nr:hypothetical protein [Xanthomonadales bacterium]